MSNAARLVTAEELERFPSDYRHELVEGRLVPMTPIGFEHGRVVVRLLMLLDSHLESIGRPGNVLIELGFKLTSNPDTVRAPDVAYVRRERVPSPRHKGFLTGPPDLAIEVLSPDDRPHDVNEKVAEYLACGTPLIVVVDPDEQSATVVRGSAPAVTLRDDDVLDLSEAVQGFACPVRDVFA